MDKPPMRRRLRSLAIISALLVVVGALAAVKALQIGRMVDAGSKQAPPPETVTSAEVRAEVWESLLSAVGSLTAVQGVTVAAELAGKVVTIAFEPGSTVKAGQVLVQQDTSSETAQLRSAEATATLARTNLERMSKLLQRHTISQAEYDRAEAAFKEAAAQGETIRAAIAKKSIRAPFAGQLGVRLVNLGQILKEGEPIVSLQSLDPVYVDFQLPQQQLPLVRTGLGVRIGVDASAGQPIEGRITTINPQVDSATRTIRVQATVANPKKELRPGMFVTVNVVLPPQDKVLAIPATAVLSAPYSDSVYIVEEAPPGQGRPATLTVRQQFVRLGEKRGDFVAVVSGLSAGQRVVSTGVFKLRHGQSVTVDNTLAPAFQLAPTPGNS
jgi:membrane fusion protein (multidrug efflux system)